MQPDWWWPRGEAQSLAWEARGGGDLGQNGGYPINEENALCVDKFSFAAEDTTAERCGDPGALSPPPGTRPPAGRWGEDPRSSIVHWRLIDPGVTRAPFWRWETSSDSSRSPFRPRVAAATPRLWQRMGCHRRTQSANEGTISIPSQLVVDVMCYLLLIFRFREPEASYLRALAAQ